MNTPPQTRALFLDRDGVINVDRGHVHRIEDFEFIDGIFELCHAAQDAGYIIIVITNQGGIGRGYYTEEEYQTLTNWIVGRFADKSIEISAVYHCPYHPEHGVGDYRRESPDRKPNPGMLLKAGDKFNIDMSKSIFIGDKNSDMLAGQRAGVGTLIYFNKSVYESSISPSIAHYSFTSHTDNIHIVNPYVNCQ